MSEFSLFMSTDSPLIPTGYANQARNIAMRMALDSKWDVFYQGWQYWGMPMWVNFHDGTMRQEGKTPGSFELLPSDGANFGEGMLMNHLIEKKPDIAWFQGDLFMFQYFYRPPQNNYDFAPSRTIMYFPSDGRPMPMGYEPILAKMGTKVAYSKFAQKQVIDDGFDALYIPLGTDAHTFHSIADKGALREKWSKRLGYDLTDKFIVGSINRMQPRKMYGELFKSFAEFSKTHPKAILLCHADPYDPSRALDPFNLANRLGIADKVVWTGMRFFRGFPERDVNEIYNLMDVHASATSGEGWGITTTEAMACEVPNVITDYTTTKEIVTDHNAGLPVRLANEVLGSYNVERGMIDQNHFVEQLSYIFDNPADGKHMGKNGRAAVLKEYSWEVVFPQWKTLFEKVVEQ